MSDVILAIDEGTTNAKVVCVNRDGAILSSAARALQLVHPQAAWAEQDPQAILEAVSDAAAEAIANLGAGASIAAVGISNQRESVVAWERESGLPLSPVVVWQCRRSEAFCEELAASEHADSIREKTGLPIDPLFPAAKIRWLLQHIDNGHARAANAEICIGTIDSWLVWHLSGGRHFVTDASNASRTQLFNIHTLQWDEALLELYGVPLACLAKVLPSSAERGTTDGYRGIPSGLPLLSQIGDSHAALYGQGGFMDGITKATYGTGSSLMSTVATLDKQDYRLAHTVAWHDGNVRFGLEGNITHTGAAVDYVARLLGVGDAAAVAELADTTQSTEGVYFVPALSGLAAPHWDSKARGIITGLTESAGPAQVARASMESIAYQVADVVEAMAEIAGSRLERLLVDGGPTRNQWLMQFQANLLDRPIARASNAEVSAIGAAYLAGKALGWWPTNEALQALHRKVDIIEPDSNRPRVQQGYEGWKQSLHRAASNLDPTRP